MTIVSKHKPLHYYQWGNQSEGWNLVDEASLSVKQERMPPGAAEAWHYHQQAQQFFYILTGVATFELDGSEQTVHVGEGLHIPAQTRHRISNRASEDLEFILCSQPTTRNDRINSK